MGLGSHYENYIILAFWAEWLASLKGHKSLKATNFAN